MSLHNIISDMSDGDIDNFCEGIDQNRVDTITNPTILGFIFSQNNLNVSTRDVRLLYSNCIQNERGRRGHVASGSDHEGDIIHQSPHGATDEFTKSRCKRRYVVSESEDEDDSTPLLSEDLTDDIFSLISKVRKDSVLTMDLDDGQGNVNPSFFRVDKIDDKGTVYGVYLYTIRDMKKYANLLPESRVFLHENILSCGFPLEKMLLLTTHEDSFNQEYIMKHARDVTSKVLFGFWPSSPGELTGYTVQWLYEVDIQCFSKLGLAPEGEFVKSREVDDMIHMLMQRGDGSRNKEWEARVRRGDVTSVMKVKYRDTTCDLCNLNRTICYEVVSIEGDVFYLGSDCIRDLEDAMQLYELTKTDEWDHTILREHLDTCRSQRGS
jgi:hypothetical protein